MAFRRRVSVARRASGGALFILTKGGSVETARLVKIEECKNALFSSGKNWIFWRKHQKGPTFTKYNIIIPISKCKDAFSPFSGEIRLFSGSKPFLYRVYKKQAGKIGICTGLYAIGRGSGSVSGGRRDAFRNFNYSVCAGRGQSLHIAKKISNICVNFQHNIVLIFQLFVWYDNLAKYGAGSRFFLRFSGLPKIFQSYMKEVCNYGKS